MVNVLLRLELYVACIYLVSPKARNNNCDSVTSASFITVHSVEPKYARPSIICSKDILVFNFVKHELNLLHDWFSLMFVQALTCSFGPKFSIQLHVQPLPLPIFSVLAASPWLKAHAALLCILLPFCTTILGSTEKRFTLLRYTSYTVRINH